jgi:hypothetical protein
MKSIGSLFRSPPEPWWGVRGDPYLWRDLARVFRPVPMPDSVETLRSMLDAAFLALTSHSITTRNWVYVDRYAHGGMSSGHVDPEFWRERGFPLILDRFTAEKSHRERRSADKSNPSSSI